jgi:transcriptional regulator with XRE-family HTH domain
MTEKYETDLDALFEDGMEEGATIEDDHTAILELDPLFLAEYTKTRFLEDLLQAMDAQGISQTELAKRLGTSRQYINRILQEQENFTVETLAKLATAVGLTFSLTLHDAKEQVQVSPQTRCGDVYRFTKESTFTITVEHFKNCIEMSEFRAGKSNVEKDISAA